MSSIPSKHEIKDASRLLDHFNCPVDLNAILNQYKINLHMADMEQEVSGFLIIKSTGAEIAINKVHHLNRQRFTIAHELGHFFLHSEKTKEFIDMTPTIYMRNIDSHTGTIQIEIDANKFAAELLMPEKYLKKNIEQKNIDMFDDIFLHKLANELKVSIQALSIRLSTLYPSIFIN